MDLITNDTQFKEMTLSEFNTTIPTSPSIIGHVSVGTNQFEQAIDFYDKVLSIVGAQRVLDFSGEAVAYGKEFPEFWVHPPYNGKKAQTGNGVHFAFMADSSKMVDEFYRVAIKAGATSDGEPGPRPAYGPQYYGCYVLDLDGNKIEAYVWDESKTT